MIVNMKLCTAPTISKFLPPLLSHRNTIRFQPFLTLPLLCCDQPGSDFGLWCRRNSSLRSTASDETSTDTIVYMKDEPKTIDDSQPVEIREEDYESQLDKELQEGSLFDNTLKLFTFLEDFNIKLDYEQAYSYMAFGSGGAVVFWLVAAIVGAIDSIPVLPKALELVGLGYTLWFTSRFLILKKNREEFFARVEEVKQQVLGSNDDD